MATVNLGRIKFVWQGAYNGATAYVADDVVSYNGSSYICILASTGNLPTNTTYWNQMSSAGTNGTNGTDLTTTLTTQGDIVYRDASGLQRLGAGTSGQFLKTNGTGANPQWSTVSSDVVLLATVNSTSGASSVSVDGYFSSTYTNYLLVGVVKDCGAVGGWLHTRFLRSGSVVTSSNYSGSGATGYGSAVSYQSTSNDTFFRIVQLANSAERSSSFTMTIYNPLGTTKWKQATYYAWGHDGNAGGVEGGAGGGALQDSTAAISGINFFDSNSSSSLQMDIKLYGMK
jgi:hypothetical protein